MFPNQLFPAQLFPPHLFDRPVRNISITDTLILSDLAGHSDQIIRIDVLTFIETPSAQLFLTEHILDTLVFTQTVTTDTPSLGITFTDHLFFTQNVSNVTDQTGGPFASAIFAEQIFSHHIFPRTFIIAGGNSYPVLIKDKLNFIENFNYVRPSKLNQSLSDTLFFVDPFYTQLGRYHYNLHDTLIFTEELSFATPPQHLKSTLDQLFFTETLNVQAKITTRIIDHLFFEQDQIQRNIDGTKIIIPGLIVTDVNNKSRYVKLQSKSDVIILPSPLFGDTKTNIADIKLNRAVDGSIYTFVKRTQRQRLNYKFEVKRQKSNELQIFIDKNDIEWINLTNWRGEMYYCKLINNPITFKAISRDSLCRYNNDKHEVELEFEGYLINGQLGLCD